MMSCQKTVKLYCLHMTKIVMLVFQICRIFIISNRRNTFGILTRTILKKCYHQNYTDLPPTGNIVLIHHGMHLNMLIANITVIITIIAVSRCWLRQDTL